MGSLVYKDGAPLLNAPPAGLQWVMQLIDSHCHLDLPAFDADRLEVLRRARAIGVTELVVPGVKADGWEGVRTLCRDEPGLHPALGLHPLFAHDEGDVQRLRTALELAPPVAIGEIGLDFYDPGADRVGQQALFEAQLALAAEYRLPVILHVRKAHDAVLACLKRTPVRGGIAHAFNGSMQQARGYIELGFKMGFGGMLTYERSSKLRRLAAELPLEAIVLETDAPDMSPVAHHGERNSPEYLPEVLTALATLRPEPIEVIAAQTTANARSVLGLADALQE